MSIKPYIDIKIEGNHFSIVDGGQESEDALSILSRIEQVVREDLQYAQIEDAFSTLPKKELYAALRQRAESIFPCIGISCFPTPYFFLHQVV